MHDKGDRFVSISAWSTYGIKKFNALISLSDPEKKMIVKKMLRPWLEEIVDECSTNKELSVKVRRVHAMRKWEDSECFTQN